MAWVARLTLIPNPNAEPYPNHNPNHSPIPTLTRWAADARQTASAVTMHLVFHRGFIIWGPPIVEGTMFFLFYVWPPLMFLLLPGFAFVLVAVVKAVRSERGLRLLGLHKPNLWFDKACVHQMQDCLTQCGLHLFEHYLDKSDRLMILFSPSCACRPSPAPVSLELNRPLRLGPDLTRVWCCYEFAWWLKHKGENSIALVPLRMYSAILRLGVKVIPAATAVANTLLGLFFGTWVVFGRWFLQHSTQAQKSESFIIALLPLACCCFLIFVICAALILVPARRERRRVARQLRTFNVREAQAWSAADKLYVLEKVRSWYGGSEEALESFNHFVRTDVAMHLGWMQWSREAVVASQILLLCFVLWCGLVFCFSIFVSGTMDPLGWPTIEVDLATWAVPDHCLLAHPWIQDHCNTTKGAGHHNWVRDARCFNGTLVDAPAQLPEDCVPSFLGSGGYDTWYVSVDAQQVGGITYAAMLCYTLAVCCGTMWWARPETRPYAKGEAVKGATTK